MLTMPVRAATAEASRARRKATDPAAELAAADNMKQRKDTTELHLGGRGLEKIDGAQMATFSNLEVLYLNDNRLQKLKGLDDNFRLTVLYANNNRIASIASLSCSIPKLRFLETLMLHNNEITDLERTLAVLQKLPRLRTLNLFGNPVAEEVNYRLITVHKLRALETLDRHVVQPAERTRAAALFSTARIKRKMAFGKRVEPWERTVPQKLHSFSVTELWLQDENRAIRARQRARAASEEQAASFAAHLPTFEYATKVASQQRPATSAAPASAGLGGSAAVPLRTASAGGPRPGGGSAGRGSGGLSGSAMAEVHESAQGVGAVGGRSRVLVERIKVVPRGHAPSLCATFSTMRMRGPSLAQLMAASGATHVFLSCDLWGIPAQTVRTAPADLRSLRTGEVDWRHMEVVTAGREAEAYAVLLSKQFAVKRQAARRRAAHGADAGGGGEGQSTCRGDGASPAQPSAAGGADGEFCARLELFGVGADGVDSKWPLAVGSIDLAELLNGERVDGRLTRTVALHAPKHAAAVLADVTVAFEVAWSPYSTMESRPSLRAAARRAEAMRQGGNAHRAGGGLLVSGDLTRDTLAYLTALEQQPQQGGSQSGHGAGILRPPPHGGDSWDSIVPREAAAAALRAVGCRAEEEDVAQIIGGLPPSLPARELAAALGASREELYATARRAVTSHMAAATEGPVDPQAIAAALRALRLHQDLDVPPPPPPSRIRHRTATSHDMLAATSLKTAADVERARGKFLPLVGLPSGEVQLDEPRYHAHELRKLQGILAEAKPTILRMD